MKRTLEKSVRVVCLDMSTRYGVIKNTSVGFDYDLDGENVSCDWTSMGDETAKRLKMAVSASMNDYTLSVAWRHHLGQPG